MSKIKSKRNGLVIDATDSTIITVQLSDGKYAEVVHDDGKPDTGAQRKIKAAKPKAEVKKVEDPVQEVKEL